MLSKYRGIYHSEEPAIRLCGSDKSGHIKHGERPTAKKTGHDD